MTSVMLQYLALGAVLFSLGAVGFLIRRNLIVMFLCVELMLQGVAINLVAFARYHNNLQGQSFTIFILTVAACEAAIALALFVAIFTRRQTLDVSLLSELSERQELVETVDIGLPWQSLEERELPTKLPNLSVAGTEPNLKEAAGKSSAVKEARTGV